LQIIGQKKASPSHAAIILSMETVFAAIGGYLLLDEQLRLPELVGCGLMLAGMLVSQLNALKPQSAPAADLAAPPETSSKR
jgi:drug/metabolite transporter (DMT)-like permease